MPDFDKTALKTGRSTARSGGAFWDTTGAPILVSALRSASGDLAEGAAFRCLLGRMSGRRVAPTLPKVWKLGAVTALGPERWGYFKHGGINTENHAARASLLFNRDGSPLRILDHYGRMIELRPGDVLASGASVEPGAGIYDGRTAVLPAGLAEPLVRDAALKIRLPGEDYPAVGDPGIVLPDSLTGAAESADFYLHRDGFLYERTSPGEWEAMDLRMMLAPHTVWVVEVPHGWSPHTLRTAHGLRFEGAGFRKGQGYLLLNEDPAELFPDGYVKALATFGADDPIHRYPMRGGAGLSLFRRRSQAPLRLFEAACEFAGVPVARRHTTVAAAEAHGLTTVITLDDGDVIHAPGPVATSPGDLVEPGSAFNECARLTSAAIEGPDWWRGSAWSLNGIDARTFWPGCPAGILLKDAQVYVEVTSWAPAVLLPHVGTDEQNLALGGYLAGMFGSGHRWHSSVEPDGDAANLFGFTGAGEYGRFNLLEMILDILGDWCLAVESPMATFAPDKWKRMKDFLNNEKPAGCIVITGDV